MHFHFNWLLLGMSQIAIEAEYFNVLPSGGWMPDFVGVFFVVFCELLCVFVFCDFCVECVGVVCLVESVYGVDFVFFLCCCSCFRYIRLCSVLYLLSLDQIKRYVLGLLCLTSFKSCWICISVSVELVLCVISAIYLLVRDACSVLCVPWDVGHWLDRFVVVCNCDSGVCCVLCYV